MNKCKSARARVLLVEDDRSDEELTRRALSRGGQFTFEVETAGSLDLVVDRLRRSTFDVVLLDLGLPACCGLEALQRIRAIDGQIPIVILTGLSDEQMALDAIEQGAQDYVVKGNLNPDSLGRSVRYSIQRRESENALEERVKLASLNASIAAILTRSEDLQATLQECCEACVQDLDAASARIWMLDRHDDVLELQATAGADSQLDGEHSRVLVGQATIGQIAATRRPYFGNENWVESSACAPELARREGRAAFAGLPLVCQDQLAGVIAISARSEFTVAALHTIEAMADRIAMGIERCRVAEWLRVSEERFECAVRGSTDGLWDWNIDTNETYLSPRLKEMLGYGGGDLENGLIDWESRLHPDDQDRVFDLLRRHIEDRAPYMVEFRWQMKSGEYRWYYARGQALWNSEGRAYRMAGSITDITDRKQMEAALAQRDEQLRQSQKLEAIGALAGGIAHEFNNLLQAISGYAKFAIDGLSADEQRFQDLQVVLDSADRAATLTRQLLSFGRKQVLHRADIDPNKVVTDLAKMLRPLIGENVEVLTDVDASTGTIYADAGQLQQALLNLCINARDAMPNGGRLVIRTQNVVLSEGFCEAHRDVRPGRHALLTVADSGCGMTADVKERIFEPFFTTKDCGKGTGLGLAMVYGMVEQHGGMIHVYSEPDSGTTFKIYLPISNGDQVQKPATTAPPLICGSETILIAEDEPLVREFVVRVLERAGYKTLTAVDGVDGLRAFQENADSISLALLDVVMPQMGGRALCQQIRSIRPDTRVIFCTGHDPETNRVLASELGAIPILQKPVDPVELLQAIRSELDERAKSLHHSGSARGVGNLDQASEFGRMFPLAAPGQLTLSDHSPTGEFTDACTEFDRGGCGAEAICENQRV